MFFICLVLYVFVTNSQTPCYDCKIPLGGVIDQSHLSFLGEFDFAASGWMATLKACYVASILNCPFTIHFGNSLCLFPTLESLIFSPMPSVFLHLLLCLMDTSSNIFLINDAREVKCLRPCISKNIFFFLTFKLD